MAKTQTQINGLVDEMGELKGYLERQEMLLQDLSFPEPEVAEETVDAEPILASEAELLNVLLLGRNGSFTDTIMVASVNLDREEIYLFSIPRDLYVNSRRINGYYSSFGVEQLKRMVEKVTGLEIAHYVEVDFQGFVETVDLLGGIEVYVESTIDDKMYPDGKGGYDPFYIEAGHHSMDGELALKYARSRYSTSDFSRAGRQQTILWALRGKLLALEGVMDLKTMSQLMKTLISYAETDLDLLTVLQFYFDYRSYDLRTGLVLSSGNYLFSQTSPVSGAYTLNPYGGNFNQIQGVIQRWVNGQPLDF